jgi:hypothetical protein
VVSAGLVARWRLRAHDAVGEDLHDVDQHEDEHEGKET